MTYAAETWTLKKKQLRKLQTAQHNMERSILNISLKDKIPLNTIRKKTGVIDITKEIKKKKSSWAGHIMRRQDNRWSQKLTTWTPRDRIRERKRPHLRWRDELDHFFRTVNWNQATIERKLWRSHVEAFVQQWIEIG